MGQRTPHLRFYRASRYSMVVMRFYRAAGDLFTGAQNCCVIGSALNFRRMVVGGVRIVDILISIKYLSYLLKCAYRAISQKIRG